MNENTKVQPQHAARADEEAIAASRKVVESTPDKVNSEISTGQNNRYYGVHGWLKFFAFIFLFCGMISAILFIIGIVLFLSTNSGAIIFPWSYSLSGGYNYYATEFMAGAACLWAFLSLSLAAGIAIVKHNRIGKILSVIAHSINSYLLVAIINNYLIYDRNRETIVYNCGHAGIINSGECVGYGPTQQEYILCIATSVIALVSIIFLILYFTKSRRVKATLTEPLFTRGNSSRTTRPSNN